MNIKNKILITFLSLLLFIFSVGLGFYLGIYSGQASTFSLNHDHTVQLALIRRELEKNNLIEAKNITNRMIKTNASMMYLLRENPWLLSPRQQKELKLTFEFINNNKEIKK